MRADDLFALRSIGAVALTADGSLAAYTVVWPDQETDENRSLLHLFESGESRLLVDTHRMVAPVFSPSGARLAVLHSAEKGEPPRPAIVDVAAGTVTPIEGYEDGAEQIAWLDEDRVVVRAARRPEDQVGVDKDELARRPRVLRTLDYRFNGRGWTHDRKRQVELVDLADGSITPLTNAEIDHADMSVAPDGSHVLVVADTDEDADLTGCNRIWSVPTDGSAARSAGAGATLLTPRPGRWAGCGHALDGRPFGIGIAEGTGDPKQVLWLSRPHLLDQTGASEPAVVGPHDVNCAAALGGAAAPVAIDGGLIAAGIRGTTIGVDRYDWNSGELTTIASGPWMSGAMAASADGSRILATVTTPTRPAELWDVSGEEPSVLVSLNDELLAELDLVEPELVRVPSTDGVEVEALITRPPVSVDVPQPGPGLVYIHGGPLSIYGQNFFDEFQLAAAEGYTVIAGNPRGSDGRGEEWASSIMGDLGNLDWEDVQALTDHLAALPEVDEQRIGIGGGSYGGFMTSWAIGHSDRYKAALVERAVTNWESFAGTSDIGTFFLPIIVHATLEDDVDELRRQSPMAYANNINTPTLILHSEEDWRCPIEQAEQLFAVLRRRGVDVTLARFPGENHELSRSGKPSHRVERMALVHGFFNAHV